MARKPKKVFWIALLLLPTLVARAQELQMQLSVNPQVVKRGQTARLTLGLRNTQRDEQFTVKASATYDLNGTPVTVYSNEVVITVDRSLTVLTEIPNRFRIVGVPQYDGLRVEYTTTNTGYQFQLLVAGDDRSHLLQVDVTL